MLLGECDFVAVDLETTGCQPGRNSVIELGAVRVHAGAVVAVFSELVRPDDPIPPAVEALTGITPAMVADGHEIGDTMARFRCFAGDGVLVAHNYRFDLSFLDHESDRLWGVPVPRPAIDTLSLARRLHPSLRKYNLAFLTEMYGTPTRPDHRAMTDALAAAELLVAMLPELQALGLTTVGQLATFAGLGDQTLLASRLPLTSRMPDSPGVYLLRDASDRVMYVGHAKDLRLRARSYFYPTGDGARGEIASKVERISWVSTHSGLDAALLERRLVDRHDPEHNAVSQRSRRTVLLHMDTSSPYPTLRVVNSPRVRGVTLGPLTSRWAATTLADALTDLYGLRRCARRLTPALASRPCPHKDDRSCPMPCVEHVDREQYGHGVESALRALSDGDTSARSALLSVQQSAAAEARYEDAIRYRDALRALDRAHSTLRTLREAIAHPDAIILESEGEHVVAHLVRNGRRGAVIRSTRDGVMSGAFAARLARAVHRVYFCGAPPTDPQRLTASQLAEILILATYRTQAEPDEFPVTMEADTVRRVRSAVERGLRVPRRRHAAV
jgi:DNA polymerase-3 subunit epsilon